MKTQILPVTTAVLAMFLVLDPAESQVCVGYRAKKTMFLVKKVEIEGRSCTVDLHVDANQAKISFDIKSLVSGDSGRDQDVADRLGFAEIPKIEVSVPSINRDDWRKLREGEPKALSVSAEMKLRGKSFPIQPSVQWNPESRKFLGEVNGQYKDFDLEVPKVVGGIVAKADPVLTLWIEIPEAILDTKP